MFGKRSSHSSNITIIGRGARFTGALDLEGDVYIEGQCDGKLTAQGQLSIGPNGSLCGELSGGKVVIAGNVEGLVVAKETLLITKTGSLRGEVYYGQLQVDPGGEIDGKTQKGPPPTASSTSIAPSAATEPTAGSEYESRVLDVRQKLSSDIPPAAGLPRVAAPTGR